MRSRKRPTLCLLVSVAVVVCASPLASHAVPLTSATVTETKNDVRNRPAGAEERPAKTGDVVKGADVVRTGERSLAEMEFNDKTIARLGSKTVFTFDSVNREFRPESGLLLISMPKGTGGGRIVTAAVTAGIEGTTVAVQIIKLAARLGATARFAVKLIVLEGVVRVFSLDGKQSVLLHAGQMILQRSDEPKLAKVEDVALDTLVKESVIILGFSHPLASGAEAAMQQAVNEQQAERDSGRLVPTGAYVSGAGSSPLPGPPEVGVDPVRVDGPPINDKPATDIGVVDGVIINGPEQEIICPCELVP